MGVKPQLVGAPLGGIIARRALAVTFALVLPWSAAVAQDDQSRHSMRGAGDSKVGAQYSYISFVTGQLRDATVLDQNGDRAGAMKTLGLGMHAIMDAFTPQHKDTAEWTKDPKEQASHVLGELAASGLDLGDMVKAKAELGKYMEAFEKRTYTYTPPILDRAK